MKIRFILAAIAAAFAIAAQAAAQQVDIATGSIAETIATLRPGQYVWAPQAAPEGPLLLVVNLATQRALLFRNGVPIAASTISTGKKGRETPTGIFTILEKQVEHYSSKYDDAPMPYMQRLTWQGVALHAGSLPGYPASHGCIRLPPGFARLLYGVTKLGMTVVISDRPIQPRIAPTPDLVSNDPGSTSVSGEWAPDRSTSGPLSIVVSAADRRALVLRNGVVIGSAPVTVTGSVVGSWAYSLRSIDSEGQHWIHVPLSSDAQAGEPVPNAEWRRFDAPDWFKKAVRSVLEPGTTIVVTADSLQNRVSNPFIIMDVPPHT